MRLVRNAIAPVGLSLEDMRVWQQMIRDAAREREARLAREREHRYMEAKARAEPSLTGRAGKWSLAWARIRPRMAGPSGRLP